LPDHVRAGAEAPFDGEVARERRDRIVARAEAEGFDAVAVSPARLPETVRRDLGLFLDQGRQGDMAWMAETRARRGDPRVLWPEAVSVLSLGLSYAPAEDPLAVTRWPDRGAISVYSRGRDYHDIAKKRAKALARWIHGTLGGDVKVFVDTAPVMEKPLAAQAGLGWAGKHTNLVSRRFGSWLFLAEVFTTLAVTPDAPHVDRCGSCSRCLSACPTGALDPAAPYRIDARLCVSYLTIEHKGPLPRPLRRAMGNRIYGCDDCLAVCPWTRFAPPSPHEGLWPRLELNAPRLVDLAGLDDAAFRAVFSGSPIKRTGRARMVRNVLVALGNSGRPDLAGVAADRLSDESPLVRGAAVWALRRLWTDAGSGLAAAKADHLAREDDPAVRAEWDGGLDDPVSLALPGPPSLDGPGTKR
jgi:epoxyqueuosine reductase